MNTSFVDDLSDRRAVCTLLRSAGVRPSVHLGQNFLVDRSALQAIADEVAKAHPKTILEIGAGLGTVTRALASFADRVVAVEIDRRLVSILRESVGDRKNVEIVHRDFLAFDLTSAFPTAPVYVVGSIPYRVTAPILNHLVLHRKAITGALLLTQQEVADKIASSPGPQGSALGVLIQAYADVTSICCVPKGSFFPIPKVDSVLWRLTLLNPPRFSAPPEVFFTLVRTLYGKRRKMVRVALRGLLPPDRIAPVLDEARIVPTARGETLTFVELDRLAWVIHTRSVT